MDMIQDVLWAMVVSITPLESKTGIPLAIMQMEINPFVAYLVCCLSNLLAFPLANKFFDTIHNHLYKFRNYKKFSIKIAKRAKGKTKALVEKHGFWGLLIFVAIPLPFTGAYMGSLAAWLFNMNRKQAFKSISVGIMCAGIIITLASVFMKAGYELLAMNP